MLAGGPETIVLTWLVLSAIWFKQLADAFSRIAEELRRQYSLGYYPKSDTSDDNARREIKVRMKPPNLAVKARDSYTKASTQSPNK